MLKIPYSDIETIIAGEKEKLPKYFSQIINLLNQNAQATRPNIVGQLSELIQECPHRTFEGWRKWYLTKYPDAIDNATDKIVAKMNDMKQVLQPIDRKIIRKWVEDLVIVKTYAGLRFQEAIIKKLAELEGKDYRLAEPDEESKGIDGYIGEEPVSIKPESYDSMKMLPEIINARIIHYTKGKDGILVETENFHSHI
jgi:hypothetical protein